MKVKDKKKFNKTKKFKTVKKQIDDELEEDYPVPKKWYEDVNEDPKKFESVTEQILIELKDEAKKCHDAEVANYNIKNSKTSSNFQWMKTVMSKGTVSDKIAAHTVAIQDNPVCNLETLHNLVNMVKVGKKRECIIVMETLTDLFLNDLLTPNQKLKPFDKRPLSLLNELSSGNAITRRKLLSLWYFEDQLKETYTSFVLALNTTGHDTVDSNKEKAISVIYKLLAGNPEQEKNLLGFLINKLGDPSQKVASKAIYCLTQLLFKHSNMQGVVLNEVEKLLFRPNVAERAQYYSLCFLSQFYLDHEASEIARKLIEVYFAFFKACIKKGELNSRMLSVLLMGINRAYPYAKLEFEKISEHIDTIYRLVHLASFNISIQALTLLYQVSQDNLTDRFYSALYRKLLDTQLLITTHQAMLLSLVYKALLKDSEINRTKMFVKRLLQISMFVQPNFACGILYLISQLLQRKSNLLAIVLKKTNIDIDDNEDEDEKYKDVEVKEEIEIKEEPIEESYEPKELKIDPNTIEIKEEDEEDIKLDIKQTGASWCHRNLIKIEKTRKYNPLGRNPLYGGAEFTAYTELTNLTNHFHPTVALYSKNILNGNSIQYSGDPIKDFTLIRFLERFVFKNPKKIEEKGAHPTFGKRKFYRPKGVKNLSVKSTGYLNENKKNIPVDELFMHSYLQQRYQDKQIKEEDSDLESVQSEEFEEMLEKMAGFKELEEEEINFMDEIGDTLKKQKNKKKNEEEEEELEEKEMSDEEYFDEGDEMDEDEFDDLEEGDKDLIDIDDEDEDIQFDELEEDVPNKKSKKKSKKNADITSLFASAEEFASLLEDEGSSKVKPGSSNVLSNKDNAHQKQLAWEEKRNGWLRGYKKAVGGKNSKFPKGKKRKGGNFDKKNKKMKR